jgi:hypothetical protein
MASVPLGRLPASAWVVCARAQDATAFPVLCPTRLPLYRPHARHTGKLRVAPTVRSGRFVAVEMTYGIPPRFRARFELPLIHFVVSRQLNASQGGGGPPASARAMTMAGMRGRLLPPDSRFPAYFDNHFRFFWRDTHGHRYVFTLHDLGPDTMTVFRQFLSSLRPANSISTSRNQ